MPKTFSGKAVIRILEKEFGFIVISQRGSHVKLRRKAAGRIITTIVPLHRELARGTMLGILELAEVAEEDFKRAA